MIANYFTTTGLPPWQLEIIKKYPDTPEIEYDTDNDGDENCASNLAMLGPSGSGKTDAIKAACKLFPQVIVHSNYKGRPLLTKELGHLRVICPKKSGARALWTNFYASYNSVMGTSIKIQRWTEADMEVKVAQDSKLAGLNFLIIDEIQNLSFRGELAEETLAAFTRLNELAGVPLVLVGTDEVEKLIEGEMHSARRASGSLPWRAMGLGDAWNKWFPQLLKTSLVDKPLKFTTETSEYFHDYSQGRVDPAVALFIKAQQLVLDAGRKEIRMSDLDKAKTYLYLQDNKLAEIREERQKKWAEKMAAKEAEEAAKKAGHKGKPLNDPEPKFPKVTTK